MKKDISIILGLKKKYNKRKLEKMVEPTSFWDRNSTIFFLYIQDRISTVT